jgi:glycosyltransferase involved in cell wall biosynthesis
MHVVVVSGEYPATSAGGIGSVCQGIHEQLTAREISHEVVSYNEGDASDDAVRTIDVTGPAILSVISSGRAFSRLVDHYPDDTVYHFHLPAAIGPMLFASDLMLRRSVITFHTTEAGFRQHLYGRVPFGQLDTNGRLYKCGYGFVRETMERRLIRWTPADAVVTTVSAGVRDEVEDNYGVAVDQVVHNGIDGRTSESSVDDEQATSDASTDSVTRLLIVGRLEPQKGFLHAFRALARIEEPYHLTVVGTGSDEDRLEELNRELSVGAEFLGYVSAERLNDAYAESDIILMPSYYEGFPMVGLEAAKHGLAIAGTHDARVTAMICDANRRLLVDAGDEEGFATTISTLIRDPDQRETIGHANRRHVRSTLTTEQMAEHYVKLYRTVAQH